jgi:hypothetical protein
MNGSHTKGCILSTNTDDQHVEWDLAGRNITFDDTVIVDQDHLAFIVNLGSLCFVKLDRSILVPEEIADRLHNGAVLDGAGSA